jgi:pantoate--beta-alanine ligase
LFRALRTAADLATAGERDPRRLTAAVREVVATEPAVELEYVEARDAATIAPVDRVDGDVLLALAARLGGTRLIDNIGISVRGDHVEVDLGSLLTDQKPVDQKPTGRAPVAS